MQKAPISPSAILCTHGSSAKNESLHSDTKESQSNKLPSSPLQTGQLLFQIKLLESEALLRNRWTFYNICENAESSLERERNLEGLEESQNDKEQWVGLLVCWSWILTKYLFFLWAARFGVFFCCCCDGLFFFLCLPLSPSLFSILQDKDKRKTARECSNFKGRINRNENRGVYWYRKLVYRFINLKEAYHIEQIMKC